MPDKLEPYRRKRSADRTPEPVPADAPALGDGTSFVIQEHHARALHWDFRLERDGVLVSWAVPKGLPMDPKTNRLAVQTEDHPLEYADFAGEIPGAEYGGGRVTIWDRGTYVTEKWSDREVMVVLAGRRVSGRYVLIRTRGKNWLLHRMDPAPAGRTVAPTEIRPMLASSGRVGSRAGFAVEPRWRGVRALAHVDGGRLRLRTGDEAETDETSAYPQLQALGATLGSVTAILDGVLVAAPSSSSLSSATYCVFDLLHLDGHDTVGLSYASRRDLLESLELAGAHWLTTPTGSGADLGLGSVHKRRDSGYEPGTRSPAWIEVRDS